jgi:hypothetical protein
MISEKSREITFQQAEDFMVKEYPEIWKICNVRHIDAPGNYSGFKTVALGCASAILETILAPERAANPAVNAALLCQCNFPTRYVGVKLMGALKHMHPPKSHTWADVHFPFPGIVFMLPRDTIRDPTEANQSVHWLSVAIRRKNSPLRVPGTRNQVVPRDEDMVLVNWSSGNCMIVSDCCFPTSQPLEPDPAWINEVTNRYRDRNHYEDGGDNPKFSSYMAAIAANLLLFLQARKEPTAVHALPQPVRILKSGLPSHPPSWVGQHYQILDRHRRAVPTGAHFTELDWRAGYYRVQHVGPRNEQRTTIKLIDPYICFTRGLVRPEVPAVIETEKGENEDGPGC